jgi:hypothetical protein
LLIIIENFRIAAFLWFLQDARMTSCAEAVQAHRGTCAVHAFAGALQHFHERHIANAGAGKSKKTPASRWRFLFVLRTAYTCGGSVSRANER